MFGWKSSKKAARESTAAADGQVLLGLARRAVEEVVSTGRAASPPPTEETWLQRPGATFVTLRTWDPAWGQARLDAGAAGEPARESRQPPLDVAVEGALRGCLGSLTARRPLIDDLWANAVAAATRDPRFAPVEPEELPHLSFEVSLLGPREPIDAASEAEALASLRPGVDGVVLRWRTHRATFLPQVWEQLPSPRRFLAELRLKAGLRADFWASDMSLERYGVEKWAEPGPLEEGHLEEGRDDFEDFPPETIEMEINDVLDLHSFPPREIGDLVRDYLDLAREKGLRQLRIIHGKGVGVQRRRVRSILEKHPHVVSYGDPPAHSGGWGATWVELAVPPGLSDAGPQADDFEDTDPPGDDQRSREPGDGAGIDPKP